MTVPSEEETRALIAEAREWANSIIPEGRLKGEWYSLRLADALEAVLASRVSTPPSEDDVAVAIAKASDADYWTDEIAEWESSDEWEREAHPDNHPHAAYEDREFYRKLARAALAVPAVPVPPTEPAALAPMSPVFEEALTDDEWVERRLAAPTEPEEKK